MDDGMKPCVRCGRRDVDAYDICQTLCPLCVAYNENAKLRAEVERLRAALIRIVKCENVNDAAAIALLTLDPDWKPWQGWAALEGKK